MRSRKHTAWKKSRRFSDVHGGRMSPKVTDRIIRRAHSLKPPDPGVETPICIEDNPSRDYYFPLSAEECVAAIRSLPKGDHRDITHLWLRRPSGSDRRQGLPLAQFICGSGVRLIVLYPWRCDGRIDFGRLGPIKSTVRWYERFGAELRREKGRWFFELREAELRRLYIHLLYHEVGHHVDWYRTHWSKANRKQAEEAAEQYAFHYTRTGMRVLKRLDENDDI